MTAKPQLKQSDAITAFLTTTVVLVGGEWTWAASELRGAMPRTLARRSDLLSRNTTKLVVLIATYAVGLQAVRQLFPERAAQEIVESTLTGVQAGLPDEHGAALLSEFDRDWNAALERAQNPLTALGGSMFNLLQLDEMLEVNGATVMDPITVLKLSSVPARLACGGPRGSGISWWKMCHDEFEVVS